MMLNYLEFEQPIAELEAKIDELDMPEFTLAFGLLSSRFKPAGRPAKPLKQWFKLWQVPPWQRARVPLLFQAGQLQVVAGYASAFAR
ncbi:tRNA lysidine(34) synthetase TilS [Alishewanella longhuensis]